YDYAAGRAYVRSGENGKLARFGDDEDFVTQARALRSLSDEALAAMRLAARETAQGISWDAVVDSFEDSLRGLVKA
ncbi:hypothetical protein, partial [Robiginitalea biformata]|uniref:hypothetical protein n=1 Tax=Robiginitalea biformata TaxID=252307 RepID=UPI003D649CD5